MVGDKCLDCLSQLRGTFKTGATQGFAGEYAEPYFHSVEPARRSGRVMKVNIRMRGQPVVVFLVGAVIVQNHMDGFARRNVDHDLVHERLEVGPFLGCSRLGLNHAAGDV